MSKGIYKHNNLSEEHKRKIGLSKKGKKQSIESIIKRGESIKENAKNNHNSGMKGKHHSEETKQKLRNRKISDETKNKMSESRKGHVVSEESKQKMRISAIEYIKNTKGKVSPRQGNKERQILDYIENEIGYSIKRQFFINGYYLDGYCPELNLAIEIDEEHHYNNGELRQRDLDRQNNIMNSLNCKFFRIRINDIVSKDDLFNMDIDIKLKRLLE